MGRLLVCGGALVASLCPTACGQTRLFPIGAFNGSVTDGGLTDDASDANPVEARPAIPSCPQELEGYAVTPTAALMAGTTGGLGGPAVIAADAAALQALALMDVPLIIQIDTMIPVVGEIRVHADKTIEGTAPGAGLSGGGLTLLDTQNIIVRRLTIQKALAPADAVKVQGTHHVWIDHCDLSSELGAPDGTYDGLVDITHASDDVTLSWNVFHDHDHPSLVGHTNAASAMMQDVGHLIVTYHHNWFARAMSDAPRVRFGTVHVFDNLYEDLTGNAVISQMGAMVLVEGNVFARVDIPITTFYADPVQGFVSSKNNRCLASCGNDDIRMPKDWPLPPPYPYTLDSPTEITPDFVRKCAGPQF
jgi:pectate lyase